jgi:hypothetical protein
VKTILGTLLALALILNSHGQGTIFLNNFQNTGVYNGHGGEAFTGSNGSPVYSSLVTSNGLIFTTDDSAQAGNLGYTAGSKLLGVDVSFQLFGGPTPDQATNIVATVIGNNITGDNVNWGQIGYGSSTFVVPNTVANNTVYLQLFVWEGNQFSTFAAAAAGGYAAASGVFANPSGGGAAQPAPLWGMPDIIFAIPEPSVLALAALAATLLIRRQAKSRV